MTYVQYLNHIN